MPTLDPNSDNQELVRRALAPPGSTSAPSANTRPPSSNKPPAGKTTAREKTDSKALTANKAHNNTPVFTSKIIEWDDQKGFGFLRHEKGKLFLHRKDFAERHKRPATGDKIHYQVDSDPKGRPCAVKARHVNDGGKITIFTWLSIILLTAVPLLAWSHFIHSRQLPLWALPVYLLIINLITYLSYKSDKAKARTKEWRTAEITLHLLEFMGGWPGALIAQRQFRHKCSKFSFQISYWLIVVFHIGLATDYIFNWEIFKIMLGLLRQIPS